MSRVNFLHLSDFHFKSPTSRDHQLVFDRLLDDLDILYENYNYSPDIIIISGDLAFSGKDEEYEVCETYLEKLLKRTCIAKRNIIIIPGNHDVNRIDTSSIHKLEPNKQSDIDKLFENKDEIVFLCRKFSGFKSFLDRFIGQENHGFKLDHPFYTKVITVGNISVGIAALNSALISREDGEYGKLCIGEFQIKEVLSELSAHKGCHLNVAVFHHPLGYLASFDHEIIWPHLMMNFDLVLNGHIHNVKSLRMEDPDGNVQFLVAGSEFSGKQFRNSYSAISVDVNKKEGTVHPRGWSCEQGKSMWIPKFGVYNAQNRDGAFSFFIGGKKGNKRKLDKVNYENTLIQQKSIQKFRPLLVAERNRLKTEVYIPLKFSFSYGDQIQKRHDIEQYLDQWLEDQDESTIFLLGEYGTGKSTFLKHYASVLAQRLLSIPNDARIPILITLGQRKLQKSIESLVTYTLAENYSLHVAFGTIESLMKEGQIVLLLDGFDEISTNIDRYSVMESFRELATFNYPNNKMIISGRSGSVLGASEVRELLKTGVSPYKGNIKVLKWQLSEKKSDIEIRQIYLQKLDDEQIQNFIQSHPIIDAQKRELVIDTLKKNNVIWELARRPVVLRLLLEFDPIITPVDRMKKVSQFYRSVLDKWVEREFDRRKLLLKEKNTTDEGEYIFKVLEAIASELFYSGEPGIDEIGIRKIIGSVKNGYHVQLGDIDIFEILKSCIFLETDSQGRFRFRHRSFMEFHVAASILRTLENGGQPLLGEKLPSIEVLDFLREMFTKKASETSMKLLQDAKLQKDLKITLIIALRQFPERMGDRLKRYVANTSEPFGVRRVAAMSLAENSSKFIEMLLTLLENDRQAQYENLSFLVDLWKADKAEIIRRTRYRLENMSNRNRPYWQHGRGIHIVTLGHIGEESEIRLLEQFENDPKPMISQCAKRAIENIKLRTNQEAKELDERLEFALYILQEAGDLLMSRFRKNISIIRFEPHDIITEADIESQDIIIRGIMMNFSEDKIRAEEETNIPSNASAEHDPARSSTTQYSWVIDPLDGTVNFASGLERFSIALALMENDKLCASAIYAPFSGDLYWARKGRGAFYKDRPLKVATPPDDGKFLIAYASSRHSETYMSRIGGRLFKEITASFRSIRLFGCASLDFCDLAAGRFDALVKQYGPPWDVLPGKLIVSEAGGIVKESKLLGNAIKAGVIAGASIDVTNQIEIIIKRILEARDIIIHPDQGK